MVWCHAVLFMQMAEVRCVVYWVTVVVGGGSVVWMACRKVWRFSDSSSSSHALCDSCRLVTGNPRSLWTAQSLGRDWMRVLIYWSCVFSASTRWVIA